MSGRCGVAGALAPEYERKDNKSVRVLTVLVYVLCVSLAAIMLSLYYVFFWEPKDAHYAQRKVHTVPRTTLPTCLPPHTGRGGTTVSDNSTEAALDALNYTSTEVTDAADDAPTPDTSAADDALAPDTSAADELTTPATVRAERTHSANITADT